jgi:hypothetical protein
MARVRILLGSSLAWLIACTTDVTVEPNDGDLPSLDAGKRDGAAFVDSAVSPFDAGMPEAGDAGSDAKVSLSPAALVDKIKALAANSECARYTWQDRGKMPKGYVKGVALAFANGVCEPDRADLVVAAQAKTADKQDDALAWFEPEFLDAKLNNSVSGLVTFRHVYTLLLGLGMRESSGKHCVGRDTSASNVSSNSAEAGAWQTSWDSRVGHPELPKLFQRTNVGDSGCFLDVFSEGVTCDMANWKNWGTGADGLRFQELEKKCPTFAAKYAAVMLRVNGGSRGHYGPLRTKAAEIKPECDAMLEDVQTLVADNPQVCTAL